MNRLTKNLVFGLIFFLQACSQSSHQWNSEAPYAPAVAPKVGDILHTATGHYLSQQQLFSNLNSYPLVYVGETHDNPASHRLQLEILKTLQTQRPGQMALGMEMFNTDQQEALDRWVAGELSEKEFLRESRWFENWGGDFELYRELMEFCRDQGIPVIGLNATKALGRKVSMTALDELDSHIKEKLPEMDMNDPYQRQMIKEIFGAHGAGAALLESFQRRQTLWDETMAESVADYMQKHSGRRMVVIAGGWHVNYGFGIPRRVHRRLPLPYVLVGGYHLVIPEEKQGQLMDVKMPEFPMPAVDYLVYQEYEVFKARGVRLGVGLDDSDEEAGLLVTIVDEGSVAAKAGMSKGDRLLRFDSEVLKESFDLIYAVKSRRTGDSAIVELKRGDEILVVEVNF